MALAHALAELAVDTVLYLDSDAYVVDPNASLVNIVATYTQPGDWSASIYFGCNGPWDRGWEKRARNAQRGPANAGVRIVAAAATALAAAAAAAAITF